MSCLLHDQKFSLLFYSEILNVMLSTILFVFEHNFNLEINYGCSFSGTPETWDYGPENHRHHRCLFIKKRGDYSSECKYFQFQSKSKCQQLFSCEYFLIHHLIIGQGGTTHTHFEDNTKVLGIESNFFEFINIIFVTLANLKVVLYFFHTFPWHFKIFKKS